MSRAMEEMEPMPKSLRTKRLLKWIDDELIPFLKEREDAEWVSSDIDGHYQPNEEMTLLSDLEAILGRSGRPF